MKVKHVFTKNSRFEVGELQKCPNNKLKTFIAGLQTILPLPQFDFREKASILNFTPPEKFSFKEPDLCLPPFLKFHFDGQFSALKVAQLITSDYSTRAAQVIPFVLLHHSVNGWWPLAALKGRRRKVEGRCMQPSSVGRP